jgi:hypothetical protein
MAIGSIGNQAGNIQNYSRSNSNRQVEQNVEDQRVQQRQEEKNQVRNEEQKKAQEAAISENQASREDRAKKNPVGNMLDITT